MSGISMRELAEILGVSVASVSVALRGRAGISEDTRARILAEARKRGYDMSRLSTPPKKGLVEIIDYTYAKSGITIDRFAYYSQLIDAISSRLSSEGFEMSGPYIPGEPSFSSRPKAVGSILLGSMISESELEEFISSNTPFVVAGNPMTRRAVNSVSHDNIGGIYAAVNHLLELGHTRIGYIRLMSGAIGDERYETYVNTLSKKGLSPVCCWDYSDEYNVMNPPKLSVIRKSFGNNAYPGTAVICDSDLTAIVFMRVMREHGLVPGLDISIVGYDDLEVAALMEPPLTSVRTFESELGSSTADLLISCIEQPGIMYRHIHIGTELRVRASTAPPPER